ncbi:MAG: undecaprenyldiphospho-muramoylpentapeptide beta-N-acetylglucosaminyltransferase [Bradymonadales bacterium]
MKKKVLIAAGGTGGHVFPAVALADAICAQDAEVKILFVGSSHGPERAWIEAAGYEFRQIDVKFFKGTSFLQKIKRIFLLPRSAWQCKRILKDEAPSVVVGSGGYVSGPMLAMASMKGYPTAIMEQNAIAGLTNRILARFVDKIFVSFDVKYPFKASKVRVLGNPVRHLALRTEEGGERKDGNLRLFVFGGSQGALSLNTGVPHALKQLSPKELERIEVVHQCGRGKLQACEEAYASCACKYEIQEFVHDIGKYYAWADLLVCRAGATSIAEIQALSKASVLIPFPYAAHNHQEKNADAMLEAGASWKILNDRIGEELPSLIRECIEKPAILLERAERARSLAKPNAARDIAAEVLAMGTEPSS